MRPWPGRNLPIRAALSQSPESFANNLDECGIKLACATREEAERSQSKAAFANAVAALRQVASPYHLAHGLLDYAEYLSAGVDSDAVRSPVAEALAIADSLGARPLTDRARGVLEVSGAEEATLRVEA